MTAWKLGVIPHVLASERFGFGFGKEKDFEPTLVGIILSYSFPFHFINGHLSINRLLIQSSLRRFTLVIVNSIFL